MPQAMDVTITMVPMVMGGCIPKACHIPSDLHIAMHGASFVRLPKSHPTTWRIVGGHRLRKHWHTMDILDRLRSLRSDAMGEQMYSLDGCDEESPAKHDVFVNECEGRCLRRKKKNLRELIPEILTIIAPSVGGVGGFPMRVLCPDRVTSPIAIELTVDSLVYLQTVATAALHDLPAAPSPPRHRRKPPSLPKGVVRDTKKQRLLCRVHDAKLGRMRTKAFNLKQFTTETEAEARATEFMSASTPTIIDIDSPSPTTGPLTPVVES